MMLFKLQPNGTALQYIQVGKNNSGMHACRHGVPVSGFLGWDELQNMYIGVSRVRF